MVYLIPGPLWDYAVLYPDSEAINTGSIQSCDVSRDKYVSAITDIGRYQISKFDGIFDIILRWFNDSLNHPDFIAAQNLSL
jgi:hypothetical protein